MNHEISFIYNSHTALKYGDVFNLEFAKMLSSFSVNRAAHQYIYDMFGFTFVSSFILPVSSLVSPVTESVLEI